MEVRQFQQIIVDFSKKWQKKRSYTATEHFTLIHLVEEVGELARQYVNQAIRKDKFSEEKLNNAIADIFMQLVALAHQRGLDIEELILKTVGKDLKRVV